MGIIEIHYRARCKDCKLRCDFYYSKRKESRCMYGEAEGAKPHLTSKAVTRRDTACNNFKPYWE